MTNADKIRKMTDEEIAFVLMCPYDSDCCDNEENCIKCCLDWLKQEVSDNGKDGRVDG